MAKKTILSVVLMLMASSSVLAEDNTGPELRERISCFPAKGIAKFVSKFQNLDANKRDTVDMVFAAAYEVNDGGELPERLFIRDNDQEENFTLETDGKVTDFGKIGTASKTAELCSEDPSREGQPKDESISFSIDSDVQFLKNTGYHDLATLKDGLKDGKSHFKKMAPAPMRLLIPKMSHVMINYEAENTVPQFAAMKEGAPLEGLASDAHCEQTIIMIEDLETLGADGLQVSGGPYKLMPVPNKKMLEKFADCSDEEDEDTDDK